MANKKSVSQPEVSESETIPSLTDLITFCRVVDLGSMTAAAQVLGESKGTVSRRMARLEEVLGTPLLRRQGRRVEPTEEGQVYREKVGFAVEVLEDAASMLRSAHAVPAGLLRVTAAPGIGSTLLGAVLPGFLETFPSISVELVLTDAVISLREQRMDVALRLAERLPDSSLVAWKLSSIAPVLVASPAYLARRGAPSDPSELGGHDYLTAPVPASQRLTLEREDGARQQVELPGRVLTHDLALLRDLALSGAGITPLLPQYARSDEETGRLVRVLPDWKIVSAVHLYLLHAGGVLAPKVRAFRDYLQTALCEEVSTRAAREGPLK
jgi:DNA-binding transcriptional LysR family regulator